MSTLDVLVVGSLHLDIVVNAPRLPGLDETLPGERWAQVFGGKGGNQAVAARRMGARVALISRVGDDPFGATLRAALTAADVDHTGVATDPTLGSGMSVAIVDAAGDYGAVIVSGANLALPPDAAADLITTRMPRVVILQNEVPEAVNRAAARAARQIGALVIWNAAPYRPDTVGLLQGVDVVVVNRVEAAMVTGTAITSRADATTVATKLASADRDSVVTLGGEGLVARTRAGATLDRPAFHTAVVSTHGAGDMFVGALAAQLAVGEPLDIGLSFAAAAAALQVGSALDARATLTAAHVTDRLTRG